MPAQKMQRTGHSSRVCAHESPAHDPHGDPSSIRVARVLLGLRAGRFSCDVRHAAIFFGRKEKHGQKLLSHVV